MEASFLKDNGAFHEAKSTNLLINEFIIGRQNNLSQGNEMIIDGLMKSFGSYSFLDWSRQKCKDLFISLQFRGKTLTL